MSFLETIESARAFLERNGRVSLHVLKREFDLDDEALDELVEELVDVQQVAAREGKVLSWIGSAPAEASGADRGAHTAAAVPPEPATAPDVAEAERRQLTVMFCDLVGSTRLASGMDPEDWREVVRSYQDTVTEVVARYDGHIAQHLGDGSLVYFGWPRAHEDDAERALRAGRDILRALGVQNERLEGRGGVRLAVRIGVHTGPVVVGSVGADERSETLAVGDTTHLAARIQTEAEPDTLLVSEATLKLVRGIFVTEEVGRRTLKGTSVPVALHRVIQQAGVRSRLDLGREQWSRFVGRDQELGMLIDRWEQATEGDGQTAFISGEAGMGKSRLALALREHVGDQPHIWLECRGSPYAMGTAFHPVIELVLQGTGIALDAPPAANLRSLETAVHDAGLDRDTVVPLMADLLGIPLGDAYPPVHFSPELQREKTLDAFVAWALFSAGIQPLLLLIEDLQWCDPSSLELFGRLIDQIPMSPILMMLTARTEFQVPWSHPKSWTPVSLGRLRKGPSHELVLEVVGDKSLPQGAVAQILERADGVPLYLEELTRATIESGETGAALTIPATLQDSLMARLDRLAAIKEVAQLASVLGREFSYPLLSAVAEIDEETLRQGLEHLVQADLLFQRGRLPTSTYTFKHALVQQTAYESLLKRRRQEIHKRTAAALEEIFPERAQAEPEVLARHCEQGGLVEQACRNYLRAGESAAGRSAHEEAIGHLRRCLSLLEKTPANAEIHALELTAQTALGASLQIARGFTHEEAKLAFERAEDLCAVVEDPDRLLRALYGLVAVLQASGELEKAGRLAEDICKRAQASGRRLEEIAGRQQLGGILYSRGDFAAADEALRAALAAYQPSDSAGLIEMFGQDQGMLAWAYDAMNQWVLGRPDAAAAAARAAVAATRSSRHPFTLAFVSSFAAFIFGMRGEQKDSEAHASEVVGISEAHGFRLWLGVGRIACGWAHAGRRGAVEELRHGMSLAGATGNQALVPLILGVLTETCAAEGRHAEALSAAELGLSVSAATGQHLWDAELLRRKGETSLHLGEHSEGEAEALFRQALDVARSQQARSLELRAAGSLARLWREQGRRDEARSLLQPAYDAFTEGLETQDLKDAKALLEELA